MNGQEYEVTAYKKCYYHICPLEKNGRPFLNMTHIVIYPIHKKPEEIQDGYKYAHYVVDGVVYNRILTSNLNLKTYPFQLMDEYTEEYSKPQQLSLFDFDDEDIEDDE